MNVVVLGAKGSAVTTTSLALAAAWCTPVVLVEADPTGGDLAAWFDLPSSPSVLTAAATIHAANATALLEHAHQLAGGLRVVPAPVPAAEAAGALGDLARGVIAPLRGSSDITLIIDAGRSVGVMLPPLTTSADLIVLVVRQHARSAPATLARCLHARHLAEAVAARALPTVVVVVGDTPYTAGEIGGFLGIDVAGVLADDPNGAAYVAGRASSTRAAARTRLATSATRVAAHLALRLSSSRIVDRADEIVPS